MTKPEALTVCWPWRLRGNERGDLHPIGASCSRCRADVAMPRSMPEAVPVCLYCALDTGVVPMVEAPPEVTSDGFIALRALAQGEG